MISGFRSCLWNGSMLEPGACPQEKLWRSSRCRLGSSLLCSSIPKNLLDAEARNPRSETLLPLRRSRSERKGAGERTGLDRGCDRHCCRYRRCCVPADFQLDSPIGLRRRTGAAVFAVRLARRDVRSPRNRDRLLRFSDLLSARRNGRRRCEADGRLRRCARREETAGGGAVDGGLWRDPGRIGNRGECYPRLLEELSSAVGQDRWCQSRTSIRPLDSVCSGHRGGSLAEFGSERLKT